MNINISGGGSDPKGFRDFLTDLQTYQSVGDWFDAICGKETKFVPRYVMIGFPEYITETLKKYSDREEYLTGLIRMVDLPNDGVGIFVNFEEGSLSVDLAGFFDGFMEWLADRISDFEKSEGRSDQQPAKEQSSDTVTMLDEDGEVVLFEDAIRVD